MSNAVRHLPTAILVVLALFLTPCAHAKKYPRLIHNAPTNLHIPLPTAEDFVDGATAKSSQYAP